MASIEMPKIVADKTLLCLKCTLIVFNVLFMVITSLEVSIANCVACDVSHERGTDSNVL